ncbi:hypothetical protein HYFRA_00004536 [Hymenoscyphus fraxineus]|uniref:Uncharacterized protein n=1 Tax=Hymenoscyphus fraxineus TaxID=746836 RepID=A0A9N9KZ56_9HELO|nr:hypothetical protein HYFRA_00004536 [Hymenoscyphus fraxineus]
MDSLFRLKDTIVGMLTPSPKRRRTAPESSSTAPDEDHFFIPRPPVDIAPSDFSTLANEQRWSPGRINPRKRARRDDSEERETVLPEDSISQVMTSVEVSFTREIKMESVSEGSAPAFSASNEDEEDVEMGAEEDVEYDSDGNEIEGEAEVEYDSDGNEIELEEVEYDSDGNEIEVEEDVEYDSEGNEIEGEESDGEVELDSDGNEIEYEEGGEEEEESDDEAEEEEYEESPEPEPEDPAQVAARAEEERLAREADLADRLADIEQVKADGYLHPDELWLYERLALRGFEPLLPHEWERDFRSLPYYLFHDTLSHKLDEKPIIGFTDRYLNHGAKYLQPLIEVGCSVAYDYHNNSPSYIIERRVHRVIKQFNKVVELDGDYFRRRILPVLTLIQTKPGQEAERLIKKITNQMTFLAKRHREYLGAIENENGDVKLDPTRRRPPLLYGIIIVRQLVIVLTLDSSDPKANIKTMKNFDLSEKTQSVWNGLGIAIVCTAARKYLAEVKDEFEIESEVDDPDA